MYHFSIGVSLEYTDCTATSRQEYSYPRCMSLRHTLLNFYVLTYGGRSHLPTLFLTRPACWQPREEGKARVEHFVSGWIGILEESEKFGPTEKPHLG